MTAPTEVTTGPTISQGRNSGTLVLGRSRIIPFIRHRVPVRTIVQILSTPQKILLMVFRGSVLRDAGHVHSVQRIITAAARRGIQQAKGKSASGTRSQGNPSIEPSGAPNKEKDKE